VKDWMNLGPRLDTFIADLIASTAWASTEMYKEEWRLLEFNAI
jgi:hypothetical protein